MSDVTQRFASGAGWLYGYRWTERLLDLVSLLVLARLLTPEDFGLVAIAASVVAILEGLSSFDVDKALIHTRGDERPLFDTAWTLALLRGVLAATAMLVVAFFLPDAKTAAVLLALAPSPLLKGLSNPRFVTFERDLVYSRLAILTLGSKSLAFVVTLTLAWLYRSYWALVAGMLASAAVSLVLTYVLRPYRPRFSLARARDIFAFSGWMSLTTLVTTLSMETDKILVGKLLGVADAGLYFMTQRIGSLPTRELISPLQRILFPSFSEIASDQRRLRRVVRESVNVLGSLSLPAGCGFALVAGDIVPRVLGETWQPIVPLLQILVPFLGLRATLSMVLPCVLALGKTRLLFRVSTLYAVVHIPAFIAGTAWFGLTGALGSVVVAGFFYTYLNVWMLGHTLGISFGEILTALRRPLVSVAAMVAAITALDAVPGLSLFPPGGSWLALGLKIAVGVVVYVGTLASLWRVEGQPAGIEQRLLRLLQQWRQRSNRPETPPKPDLR